MASQKVRNLDIKMPAARHFTRVDLLEIASAIERKLGRARLEKYFDLLNRFIDNKIIKPEFDKLCIATIGRENMHLHNHLLRSMLKNACLAKTHPPKQRKVIGSFGGKLANGYQRSSQSQGKDYSLSPQKGKPPSLPDGKFKDNRSPLGPHGKSHSITCEESIAKIQEQQSATELFSLGSRPPGSVEEGEEVDQAAASPSIYSRSPVRAPLGIPMNSKGIRKVHSNTLATATCHSSCELPDTGSLKKRLEQKLEMEALKVSVDCVNLLNNGLDVFLRRLIKPCLELAGSRSLHRHVDEVYGSSTLKLNAMSPVRYMEESSGPISVAMLDFQMAMELNPHILGEDGPTQREWFAWVRQKLELYANVDLDREDYRRT